MTLSTEIAQFNSNWYIGATSDEQQQFRTWLINLLETTPAVKITFVKSDGTIRDMQCTTMNTPSTLTKRVSDTICTVWDIELKEWRSFKFENIKNIDFKL